MKKIPTIFERDWNGDKSHVLDKVHAGCEWVFAGEGTPTRKIDGTSCLVKDGKLWKRRELRPGDQTPDGFMLADIDTETGKTIGWMPVLAGPEDRWHLAAFSEHDDWQNGTYELVGPKVQGNPEGFEDHRLVRHGSGRAGALTDIPRTFEVIKDFLAKGDMEGIVWHHPDGRMAKIKARDFGLKREK